MKSARKQPGLIVIISSPSGTGKTTICHKLIKRNADFVFSVSATTRPPRKKEKDGTDYYFLTESHFSRMQKNYEFVEWANVFGFRYGTPKKQLVRALKENRVLLCDVDIQGGMSIKKKHKDAVSIFVIPPSLTELKRRLFKRRTESPSQKKLRLRTAIKELRYWKYYDYVVLNDDLKVATDEIDMIIGAERMKAGRLKNGELWSRARKKLLGL